MNGGVVVAVVAAIVVLRIWLRRRRRSSRRSRSRSRLGPWSGTVALVMGREIRQRLRGTVFRAGTVLILAVVAAVIVIPTFNRGTPRPEQVGVVGALPASMRATVVTSAASVGTAVHVVQEADVQAADRDLRAGHINLAIVDRRMLVVNKTITPTDVSTTAQLAHAVATNLGAIEAVESANLSAGQASQLAGAKALPVIGLQPATASRRTRSTSPVALILVFLMLSQYCTWTLIGVMEEKSSRVVELLLAAVRPVQLLSGKVLGIGLVALGQAALILVFALGLANAVGAHLPHGTTPLVLVATLAWLVVGYAFYCWVYAAAGSMAERQDQIQSLALPLSLPIVFGYIMALTTATSGNPSAFFNVLAYLPPTAPFAMPVLVGLGTVTWWEFTASAAVSIVCTVGVARLATTVYRRAILRTGRPVHLREMFARTSR
jgi:ABC-2 type transport system permease protein